MAGGTRRIGVEASRAGIQYCVGEVGFIWGRPMRGGKGGKEERDVVRRQKVQTGGGAARSVGVLDITRVVFACTGGGYEGE